jgi:hypothetical protein
VILRCRQALRGLRSVVPGRVSLGGVGSGGLGAVANAQLDQDGSDMFVRRLAADEQGGRDLDFALTAYVSTSIFNSDKCSCRSS